MTTLPITRRLSWAVLLTLPLLFSQCSKKGTDVVPSAAALQGSWRLSAYTIDPAYDLLGTGTKTNDLLVLFKALGGQQLVDCFKATTITFNANGKVTSTTTAACTSVEASPIESGATWVLTGNKLKITEGSDVTESEVSISGNTLRIFRQETEDFDDDGKNDTATLSLILTKV